MKKLFIPLIFLDALTIKPLTRGPVITGEICEPSKGENCENAPLECACYPNEKCNISDPKANKKGCVGEAPANSHLDGNEYVCDEGYEWNKDLTECILAKTCPPNSFKFQDECYCKEGYDWNADKTECIPEKLKPKIEEICPSSSEKIKDRQARLGGKDLGSLLAPKLINLVNKLLSG